MLKIRKILQFSQVHVCYEKKLLNKLFFFIIIQAVMHQGLKLDDLLPDLNTLQLMMMHPLSVQVRV